MGGYFAGIMNDEDRHGNGEAHGAGIEHPGGGSGIEQYMHGGQGAGGGACGDVGTVPGGRPNEDSADMGGKALVVELATTLERYEEEGYQEEDRRREAGWMEAGWMRTWRSLVELGGVPEGNTM